GRIFGAYDYETGLPFDWLDAMLDYRYGTDLIVVDANNREIGTGVYGPVYLYEYGTDPMDLIKSTRVLRHPTGREVPAIRGASYAKAEAPPLSYRTLPADVRSNLSVAPTQSPRGARSLSLGTTWLQRVEAYRGTLGKAQVKPFVRGTDAGS
ncbi:MAG TPA: hypothetical protein PKI11_18230, partial [Candidatus Hydrogenedentes bacterium]|nr:hypothetical protein [Candidatus Hydrogenedentota bacterium]